MNTMQHTKKSKKALLALATTLLLGGGLVLAGCSTTRAEYEIIIDEFNTGTPYTNIIKSEETHIAYLTELFDAYGIALPADTSSTHLAVLSSLLEAAKTGVQAELDNIAMYEKFLAQDGLPDDVKTVFTELMNASKSHLAAFENKVDKLS